MTEPNGSPPATTRHDVFALLVLLAAVLWPFRDTLVGDGCMLSFDTRRTGFAPFQVEKPPDVDARPANLVTSDINGWIVPEVELMVREMRAGRVPLWNPYVLCGQPLLANLAFSPFYPPNWLALVVDPLRALAWIVVLHFWLAGAFAYAWLRTHGNARGASLVGALAVALTSWLTTRFHLPSIAMTAAWFPGLLLAFERLLARPGMGRATVLAACVGGAALAGFPQLVVLELLGLGVYALVRTLQERAPFVRLAGWGIAATWVGLALGAIQLLPTAALFAESLRASYAQPAIALGLRAPALFGLLHPYAFGDPVTLLGQVAKFEDYLPHRMFLPSDIQENAVENALWIGILPLVLAIVALTTLRRDRAAFALVVVVAIGCVFAFGFQPAFLQTGSPKRGLVLVVLPLAMLGGVGFQALLRDGWRSTAGVAARLALGVLVVAYFMCVFTPEAIVSVAIFVANLSWVPSAAEQSLFASHLAATSRWSLGIAVAASVLLVFTLRRPRLAVAVAVLVIAADLGMFARGFNPAQERAGQYPETPAVKFARDSGERTIRAFDMTTLPALIGPLLGYRSADGGEPMVTRRIGELYEALEPGRFDPRDPRVMNPFTDMKVFSDPLFLRTATSLVVANRELALPDADVVYANEAEGMGVYRLKNAIPRVRLVEGWNSVPLAEMLGSSMDPRRVVSVQSVAFGIGGGSSGSGRDPPGEKDPPEGSAKIVRDDANEVVVDVNLVDRGKGGVEELFPQEAWLVLADTFDPGWTATRTDEGAEPVSADVYRADHAFRAVRVSSKTRQVTFRYEPSEFFAGAKISAFALLLLISGALEAMFVQRRRESSG